MRKRLDEILISKGLITEAEVREALLRQKAYGGRFGSMLLYYRHIDEEKLVDALSAQLDCEGVILSKIDIPEGVAGLIPAKIAVARRVMPFAHDAIRNELKVACLDPTDPTLLKELGFVARGKNIKPYVAAEIALNTAIAKYYLGQDKSLDDNLLLEIPDDATLTGEAEAEGREDGTPKDKRTPSRVLIVTDEGYSGPMLQSILERDGVTVAVTDSPGIAVGLVRSQRFETVLVKSGLAEDLDDLSARLRALAPETSVHAFENASALILDGACRRDEGLIIENLNVFTSLLSSMAKCSTNHASQVGRSVYRLCRKMKLPDMDTALISDAAYVHDIARYYYGMTEGRDSRETISLSVRLLASMGYSPKVLNILHATYGNIDGLESDRISLATLGGSIITAVDLYCHSTSSEQVLSLDRLDAVKRKLGDLAGKILLRSVVEALVEMITEETLDQHLGHRGLQVIVYAEDPTIGRPLDMRLRNEGFRTLLESTVAPLVDLCKRSQPDMVVLVAPGKTEGLIPLVESLNSLGNVAASVPVFVVTDEKSVANFTGLLGSGIEDIIVFEENLDLLMQKLTRAARIIHERGLSGRTAGAPGSTAAAGMSGRLADMNLVDLIQALGLGRKTVKITVQNDGDKPGTLTIYLKDGALVFAELGDLVGATAVYEGMAWGTGTWSVEPANPAEIPESNNEESNEAILMEGCRLIDEHVKTGHLL
jgi:DNA-binding response OmpR family regulator